MRHTWNESGDKPWTCASCGMFTANLRHIENGHCLHDWQPSRFGSYQSCSRCGVVQNPNNAQSCIGAVKVTCREGRKSAD